MAQLQNLIPFNPLDPYPLLPEDSYTYEAAKSHSFQVDRWLGFPPDEEQEKHPILSSQVQTWAHLSSQQYQTPYCELRNVLESLQPKTGQTLIDLGCGYARLAFVMGRHFPETSFLGFEIDSNRVQLATDRLNFHKLQNAQVKVQDLSDPNFILPNASYYFLFDYGNSESILKTLEDLKKIAKTQSIKVVGRGRASRHFIQEKHPWLSQVYEPQHTKHYSIYSS